MSKFSTIRGGVMTKLCKRCAKVAGAEGFRFSRALFSTYHECLGVKEDADCPYGAMADAIWFRAVTTEKPAGLPMIEAPVCIVCQRSKNVDTGICDHCVPVVQARG